MRSKTIELFVALSLATTVVACNASNEGAGGGEAGETAPKTEQKQQAPTPEGGEGGEGGEEGESKSQTQKKQGTTTPKDSEGGEGGEGGEGS